MLGEASVFFACSLAWLRPPGSGRPDKRRFSEIQHSGCKKNRPAIRI